MSYAILSNKKVRRRLDIGKSTYISIGVHLLIIFGITFSNVYNLPTFDDSPIINIRLANSSIEQDGFLSMNEEAIDTFSPESSDSALTRKDMRAETYKVKRLEANSEVNSSEAANVSTVLSDPPFSPYLTYSVFGSDPAAPTAAITLAVI